VPAIDRPFLALVLLQGAHSIEEYVGATAPLLLAAALYLARRLAMPAMGLA
jgi:hypothetical protein